MSLKQFSIVLFFISFLSFSQELPPIVKHSPTTYNAGNQNWMISQDKNQFVFFANNEGLLEFNGSDWKLYQSPNETIIRSVKVIDNKIYTGCYMEFGCWERHSNGQLKYNSLSEKIKSKIKDDEQFWNIINYEHWVLFQSLNRIYIYDLTSKSIQIIDPNTNITKSFKTNNGIYFQTLKDGLFEIEKGKSVLKCNNEILKSNKIVNIFEIDDNLIIQIQNNGLYKFSNNNLSKFISNPEIESNNIYCSQLLTNGNFAIGSVSNGLYIISNTGTILYHITQNRGLSNNTVLSLFEDIDKNLWIGLDNGINCINLKSPIKSFSDDTGFFGTVYASALYSGKLYIGTNQGLFYKNYNSNESFSFIKGTKGQVWSLFEYDNSLFCGHDSGTFIIENGVARNIFSQSGTWKFNVNPKDKKTIIQGNYYGLSVLEKINNQWKFRNKIAGFDYSSKYFEINNNLNAFVSHEYKGIFNFQIDNDLMKIKNFKIRSNPSKGKNAGLVKFNNTIYYAYKEGVFKFNYKTNEFEKDNLLSSVFEKDQYSSGKMIVDKSNKLWLFSKNYINYFTTSKLSSQLKQNSISITSSLTNALIGYENISQLTNSEYLVGTTDGYYRMNINDLSFKNYNVVISNVHINKLNEAISNISITDEGSFKHNENYISFSFAVPEYNKYFNPEYRYILEGFQDNWSEWSTKSSVNFDNLPTGSYVFRVKSKIHKSDSDNIVSYQFTIKRPWYATIFALFSYFILAIVAANYIHKAYKKYYQKQREKLIEENNLLLEIKELEKEQELMKLRNEQLTQDFDTKNRELAVSTMSLIKKDELLSLIKEDLKSSSEEGNSKLKSVISTITRNISTDNSWNVFKEAFDTADKDFLKKVKTLHPSLTPNDLRLCAYLRLNLSSKEIAPLINISVRSVEIKRYRLRKKMELPHEQGLIEYILSI